MAAASPSLLGAVAATVAEAASVLVAIPVPSVRVTSKVTLVAPPPPTAVGVATPPPPPCVSGKFRDFWRRGVRNTQWGLHDVGVGENEEI